MWRSGSIPFRLKFVHKGKSGRVMIALKRSAFHLNSHTSKNILEDKRAKSWRREGGDGLVNEAESVFE